MAEAGWTPKREARRFEPPPWERGRFEELQRLRGETEAATASSAEAEQPAAVAVPAGPLEPVPPPEPADAAERPETGVADAQVEAMLVQLSAEEPRVDRHMKVIGLYAAGVMIFLGASMLCWGVLAGVKAKGYPIGIVGSVLLDLIGIGFGVLGWWFGVRATKQGD